MKKARFTETRIVPILRQQEAGKSVRDISREHGISDATDLLPQNRADVK